MHAIKFVPLLVRQLWRPLNSITSVKTALTFLYGPSRYPAEAHRSKGTCRNAAEVEELMRSELYAAMVAIANYNIAALEDI